jgi:hypothetical protein
LWQQASPVIRHCFDLGHQSPAGTNACHPALFQRHHEAHKFKRLSYQQGSLRAFVGFRRASHFHIFEESAVSSAHIGVSVQAESNSALADEFEGSHTMKSRANNAYLCIVNRELVGRRVHRFRRTRRFPSPWRWPAFVNSAIYKASTPRGTNLARLPTRNAHCTRLSTGKTRTPPRFVDSAIVVIQSGITPRAQLRAAAQTLRRLEVPAARFAFKRVLIRKGKPWLRQSGRGVDQRFEQLRMHCSPRTRPSEPCQSETVQESSVVTKPELVKTPDQAPPPDASLPCTAPEQQVAAPSSVASSTDTATGPESALSARMARGRGEPQRPALPPRTTRPSAVRPPAPHTPSALHAPSRRPAPPSIPAAEPPRAPVSPARSASLDRVPKHSAPLPPPPGTENLPHDLASEHAEYPASRLSGLRNLLVSLGRRSLNQDEDLTGESHSDIEPRFGRATVRAAFPDSIEPEDCAPDQGIPTRLAAQPEFLPPRATSELEKEKEAVRPTPFRRDNPDGDEIQTLPSWRGQYRKKRYPPV